MVRTRDGAGKVLAAEAQRRAAVRAPVLERVDPAAVAAQHDPLAEELDAERAGARTSDDHTTGYQKLRRPSSLAW